MISKKSSVKKLILFFGIFVTCMVAVMALLTAGPKTWDAIRHLQARYMLLALTLGVTSIALDSIVLMLLSSAAGTDIGFFYSAKTLLFYMFLSSITPTVTGGEPLIIYQLTQKNMPFGKATSVTLVRGILIISIIAIAAPVIVYFHGDLIQDIILRALFRYVAICLFLLVAFITYASFKPSKGEEIIHIICLGIGRHKALAKYIDKVEQKLRVWIGDFAGCLKEFVKYKKKTLLAGSILSALALSANYLIAYVILRGLNYTMPVLRVLMVQFVLYFMLYFTPTPGGTGVAEGGCYAMFAASIPNHLLGIFIILWRFFTIYLWVIVGGILVTKTIGLDLLDKISNLGGPANKEKPSSKMK